MRRQHFMAQIVALVVIGVGAPAVPALGQDCPELVGRLPGPVSAVAVSGDYAYVGGELLFITDVSDPSAPRVVGEVGLRGFVEGVAVSGDYAYVAADSYGLRIIDVSMPSAPVEVGSVDTPGDADSVAVSGGYAYVADGGAGLRVIDVSTPSTPVEVAFLDTFNAADVAVSGDHAYVAGGGLHGGLRVIDVSTPSAPVEVGFAVLGDGGANGVAVAGTYAYVSGFGGLSAVDVHTPSAPVVVGVYEAEWGPPGDGVAASGDHVYVAAGSSGFRVIDVSTPSAPVEVGFVGTLGEAYDVAVLGDYTYVVGEAGLLVIDVSTPSTPVEVTVLGTGGPAQDFAASGDYAYVAVVVTGGLSNPPLLTGRFVVIDVSVPSVPVVVGFLDTPDGLGRVAVEGDYAYAMGEGLHVIDVSTPSTPVEVGFIDVSGRVAVSGSYAYVVNNESLRVIDVGTPSAPVEVGFLSTPSQTTDVAVSGPFAYVTLAFSLPSTGGLLVIDVSTPSAPVEVGSVGIPDRASGVTVTGGYAYVADGGQGLRVIDVTSPSAPVEVGFLDTPGLAIEVAVAGDYAYVEDRAEGLHVIDVSTPTAPVEVGFYETKGWGAVAASDGFVFSSAGDEGMYVFRECTRGPILNARECVIPAAAVAAGTQGAFFQTDVEVNNTGNKEAEVHFQWLPRGEDNSEPVTSDPIALAAGQSLRYENVLTTVFGLAPDSVGAIKLVASTESVIGMSRTYNIPAGETAGTFGQGLPAIRATEMIQGTEPQRIIFLSEDPDSRANVGCVNGTDQPLRINIGVFDAEGSPLETKTMDLAPYSNNQINRVFRDYQPVNGYVDVWADSDEALYYCYGSMLDNLTSDPTTILPQVPSADISFIPAAALAAGLEGAFFSTDVDLNNVGSADLTYELLWLPRGADNSDPIRSDTFSLAPGASVRYANVLDEVFGLEPDQVGALAIEASGIELLAMSRTYNLPSAKVAGTFGQELPGIPADRMIASGVKKRIIFMNENDDVRSNVGCQNGSPETVRVFIELFNAEGESLETRTMDLVPYSNNQVTRVFRNYSPIEAGYVDVWTMTPGASIYCYGSVLDNLTSDPTTVLPQ